MYLAPASDIEASAPPLYKIGGGSQVAGSKKHTSLNLKAAKHCFRKTASLAGGEIRKIDGPPGPGLPVFGAKKENATGTNKMPETVFVKDLKSFLSHYFPTHTLVCSTTFNDLDPDEKNILLSGVKEILIGLQALDLDHKSSLHVQCSKRGIEFHLHSPQIILNSEAELFPSFQRVVDLLASGSWSYTQEPSGKNGMFIALLTANSRPYDH